MTKCKYILSLSLVFFLGALPIQAAKYKALKKVKNGVLLTGQIVYDGTAPAPRMLKVNKDTDTCGSNRPSEELIVSSSGGIKNVVVSIVGIKKGKKWGIPKKFSYDQNGCRFVPHVLLVRPKSKGVVLNSDNVGHNFHTVSKGVYNINKKIKANAKMKVKKKKIKKAGIIRVKCDLHSWMGGWWVAAKTPYTELSDDSGKFSISDIPPGKYKLKIWQEKLGEVVQDLVIKAGEAQNITIKMK
jgi:plastocyanin